MTINEDKPQDELEQKISEAEMEAQIKDSKEPEESSPALEVVSEDSPEETLPEKKGLSRARKIWRQILVWLVVFAIAFASGFFLDAQLRLEPALAEIDSRGAEIDSLGAEIDSLEAEIERLGAFEDQNTALAAEMDQLNIHLVLLSVRASVADASLAVEQGRQADAKLALNKVGSTLEALKGLLNAEQAEIVENMISRYQLVIIELDNDGTTVQTDLNLIATKLLTLENTLFASP